MNRRVIFPDPAIWTQPKDHTMTNPEAADARRATALTVWYGRRDSTGINTVLQETVEADRTTELIAAVLDLHAGVIPILLTTDGLACLTQMIYSLAADENADPDCARAARLIVAHSERNTHAYNAVLLEAATAERTAKTLLATLTNFSAFVPQLYSDLGLEVLQRNIINWAAREDDV